MEDADVVVDQADVELDPASQAFLASDEADKTTRVNVETLREFSGATPEGKRQRIVLRFLPRRSRSRATARSNRSYRQERAGRGGRRLVAKDTGEREELECGLVLRSVGYTGVPIEGVPFDNQARPDPQRGRPGARLPRRGPQGRPLHRGLDQARALRRDRHEQERRPGDGGGPARRRRVADPAGTRRARSRTRSSSCSPRTTSASSASRTGRRSTRPRSAAASPTADPGSSSSASRRCSTRSARGRLRWPPTWPSCSR